MDTLAGEKLIFYKGQLSERVTTISVDVALKYVAEKELEFCCQQTKFQSEKHETRATELNLLITEQLATNNLEAERHLAGFCKRVSVAKYRNKKLPAI